MKTNISVRIPKHLLTRIESTTPHGLNRSQWINHLIGQQLDFYEKSSSGQWKPKPRQSIASETAYNQPEVTKDPQTGESVIVYD